MRLSNISPLLMRQSDKRKSPGKFLGGADGPLSGFHFDLLLLNGVVLNGEDVSKTCNSVHFWSGGGSQITQVLGNIFRCLIRSGGREAQ